MDKRKVLLVILGLLAVAAIGFFLMPEKKQEVIKPMPPVKPAPPRVVPVTPPAPPPVKKVEEPPLPALSDSDPVLRESLSGLFGTEVFKRFFRNSRIVRHIVVTIDNLPRKNVAIRLLPVKPVRGKFITEGEDESLAIAAKNASRYRSYVKIAELVDAKMLVATYSRLSPLFQQAYQELGYPNGSFNDRLVTVINHLLGAPDIKGPVMLVQPNVVFKYADPALESQSSGRKILMRMGHENEVKVKNKLREIKRALAEEIAKKMSK